MTVDGAGGKLAMLLHLNFLGLQGPKFEKLYKIIFENLIFFNKTVFISYTIVIVIRLNIN